MAQPTYATIDVRGRGGSGLVQIDLVDASGDASEPEGSYLFGDLSICGVGFHVEAIEVRESEDGTITNEGVAITWRSRVDAIENEMETSLETITIRDREYVVIITPHGR